MASQNLTGYGPSNIWQNLTFDGNERKYDLWETKILGYMKLKKLKMVFVTEVEITEEQNETAFSELIQFLDERSLSLIIREARDDGRKAWKILREFYASSSKPRIITLYNQLTTLQKTRSETVTDYLIRAENTAMSLRSVGEQVSDALLIAMVLKGLPDEYKAFVAVTTHSENVQTFQKFKASLRNFEETENTRRNKNEKENSVLKTFDSHSRKPKQPITCYNCGTPGHKSNECQKEKSSNNRWCRFCKSNTHHTRSCRKNKDNANKAAATDDNHTFTFKVDVENTLKSTTDTFLVDCGATAHIVNNDTGFIEVDKSFDPKEHYVELADGTRSNNIAKAKGTFLTKFYTTNGDEVEIKLTNVLYIPSFPQCIFSVQAATKNGCKLNFQDDSAELVTQNGTVFPVYQQDRLYYLYKSAIRGKRAETLKTWHQILGHCNPNDISRMENHVQDMKISDSEKFDCEVCTLAKQPNTRNREPDVRATQPFELVHTDLSGPIEPVAKDGFRYTIVFTDDFSGCMFTYSLKQKADACQATEKFLADIAPYGKVKTLSFDDDIYPVGDVKRVRSDNGGEFTSGEFKNLLLHHSIKHEKSAPYSPHQNGTAERSWRTLFEMARSLLLESGLPKFLWTYAVMAATHIRNRCYSQRIQSTPYGLITGIKPNIARMHIFGTLCYPFVQNAKKLDPRSKRGVFVGYDRESPAYLVYDPETKSVSKHRLVKFTDTMKAPASDASDQMLPGEPTKPEEPAPVVDNQPATNSELRRNPSRTRQPPSYLNDYEVENNEYEYYVNRVDYCYYISAPSTYRKAIEGEHADKWNCAMNTEIEALKHNDTFIVTDLPEGKSIVGGRWVFALKGDPENPDYKARYVAKGYSQVEGIDYNETFSPTARMETLRTLVQVACQNDLLVHQMDVKSAFLHAPIDEEIYVNQPEGYSTDPSKVWRLKKSLYGLKQSGRNWNVTLYNYLKDIGFTQSKSDPCLFLKISGDEIAYLLVWVDDIIIAASTSDILTDIKTSLSTKFKMKDLQELDNFLGIKFKRTRDNISMTQEEYIRKVLKRFRMEDSKPRSTPCEQNPSAYETDCTDLVDIHEYRQMVGSLIYAMICTRPDLSYVVTKLSQHLSCPTQADAIMLKHVFRYLNKTADYRMTFTKSPDPLRITAFCDADWAASSDRRSISGYCVSLNMSGPPICWKSQRQKSVALSTCEAEYVAMSIVCQEVVFLKKHLLSEMLGIDLSSLILCDNQGAIALSKNPTKHSKAKHIDIRYHFVRESLANYLIDVDYVPSNENFADIFTKPPKKFLLEKFNIYIFGRSN